MRGGGGAGGADSRNTSRRFILQESELGARAYEPLGEGGGDGGLIVEILPATSYYRNRS